MGFTSLAHVMTARYEPEPPVHWAHVFAPPPIQPVPALHPVGAASAVPGVSMTQSAAAVAAALKVAIFIDVFRIPVKLPHWFAVR